MAIAKVDLLDVLLERRSSRVLVEPGPTEEELELILRAATTVPDHGSLTPWRFVVVAGDARVQLGDALAVAVARAMDGATPELLHRVRRKALEAPTSVVLVASRKPSRVPAWEQDASAACTGYAMVLAAAVLGLGAIWKSTSLRDDPALRRLLALHDDEHLLGWVQLGRRSDSSSEAPRDRVALDEVVTVLPAGGAGGRA